MNAGEGRKQDAEALCTNSSCSLLKSGEVCSTCDWLFPVLSHWLQQARRAGFITLFEQNFRSAAGAERQLSRKSWACFIEGLVDQVSLSLVNRSMPTHMYGDG